MHGVSLQGVLSMNWVLMTCSAVCLLLAGLIQSSFLAQTTRPAEPRHDITLVSANIRYANPGDGPHRWELRRAFAVKTLVNLNPDLIGFQEVLHQQLQHLKADLPGYEFVGVGRDDGKTRGEYSPIAFRRERYELEKWGTLWLSPTPDVVGSKGWDAALPRICTWAILKDKPLGTRLLCANTHFDHRGQTAQLESARLLAQRLPQLAADAGGLPILLTGDFNVTEDSPALQNLTSQLNDTYRAIHPKRSNEEATFHDFKGITQGSRIDFILASNPFTPTATEIDRSRGTRPPTTFPPTDSEPLFASDHFFIWTRVTPHSPR